MGASDNSFSNKMLNRMSTPVNNGSNNNNSGNNNNKKSSIFINKNNNSIRKKKHNQSFPNKLMDMMEYVEEQCDGTMSSTISWVLNGRGIQIYDREKVIDVVSLFFGITKYNSFRRQLNMWDFERVRSGPHKGAFIHPYFVRGSRKLVNQMNRQIASSSSSSPKPTPQYPSSSNYNSPAINNFQQQVGDQINVASNNNVQGRLQRLGGNFSIDFSIMGDYPPENIFPSNRTIESRPLNVASLPRSSSLEEERRRTSMDDSAQEAIHQIFNSETTRSSKIGLSNEMKEDIEGSTTNNTISQSDSHEWSFHDDGYDNNDHHFFQQQPSPPVVDESIFGLSSSSSPLQLSLSPPSSPLLSSLLSTIPPLPSPTTTNDDDLRMGSFAGRSFFLVEDEKTTPLEEKRSGREAS